MGQNCSILVYGRNLPVDIGHKRLRHKRQEVIMIRKHRRTGNDWEREYTNKVNHYYRIQEIKRYNQCCSAMTPISRLDVRVMWDKNVSRETILRTGRYWIVDHKCIVRYVGTRSQCENWLLSLDRCEPSGMYWWPEVCRIPEGYGITCVGKNVGEIYGSW